MSISPKYSNKKPWISRQILVSELSHLGFKEINVFDANRKFVYNINIFVKFFYRDISLKKLVESPLYLLDKDILKDKTIPQYTAFDFLFQKLKMQEVFPHPIMTSFIYTDNRTTTPKQFVIEKEIPLNQNQSFFNFS